MVNFRIRQVLFFPKKTTTAYTSLLLYILTNISVRRCIDTDLLCMCIVSDVLQIMSVEFDDPSEHLWSLQEVTVTFDVVFKAMTSLSHFKLPIDVFVTLSQFEEWNGDETLTVAHLNERK